MKQFKLSLLLVVSTMSFLHAQTPDLMQICPSGTALDFDGNNDYVEMAGFKGVTGTHSRTVSAWIKTATAGDIITWGNEAHGQRWWMFVRPTIRSLAVGVYGGWVIGETDIQDNQWHHVAAVLNDDGSPNADEIILYVDGKREGFRSVASMPVNTGNDRNVKIGFSDIKGREYFNGLIDDIRIWDIPLTQEQILANMHRRLQGNEPGLVACWNFDEGEGQFVYDSSPGGNHGILGATDDSDGYDPEWVFSDAPVGICVNVDVDIKPGSCPNPLSLASRGITPVAILGSADFDVLAIDLASVRLAGASPVRSDYEDIASAVTDANECACTTAGVDGFIDLALKFKTRDIVEQLINAGGELAKRQILPLEITGQLTDGIAVSGTDCVRLVGNVPKYLLGRVSDVNADGIINMLDLQELAGYWLEKDDNRNGP